MLFRKLGADDDLLTKVDGDHGVRVTRTLEDKKTMFAVSWIALLHAYWL